MQNNYSAKWGKKIIHPNCHFCFDIPILILVTGGGKKAKGKHSGSGARAELNPGFYSFKPWDLAELFTPGYLICLPLYVLKTQ